MDRTPEDLRSEELQALLERVLELELDVDAFRTAWQACVLKGEERSATRYAGQVGKLTAQLVKLNDAIEHHCMVIERELGR